MACSLPFDILAVVKNCTLPIQNSLSQAINAVIHGFQKVEVPVVQPVLVSSVSFVKIYS